MNAMSSALWKTLQGKADSTAPSFNLPSTGLLLLHFGRPLGALWITLSPLDHHRDVAGYVRLGSQSAVYGVFTVSRYLLLCVSVFILMHPRREH